MYLLSNYPCSFYRRYRDEALIRGRFLTKDWREIQERRVVRCEKRHRWTVILPMLRSEIWRCCGNLFLLLKSHSLIDPKGKKALAVGYCDLSDAEKNLHPSINIPSLIMSEIVQDALVCFGCLWFLDRRRKQALIR
jgi:hypothetical protein